MFRIRITFRRFAEESVTSDDAEFMPRLKGRSSAIDTYNFFLKTNHAKIKFFDDEIFFLLFDMNQKNYFSTCNIPFNRPASV